MVTAGAELALKTYLHPQPVIIGCTGHAVAAGALFLCAADYRIGVLGEFKIGLNETSIGLSLPTWGLELARDRLDNRMLNRATLGSELYAPVQAAEVGYLDEVVDLDKFPARLVEKAKEYQKVMDAQGRTQIRIWPDRIKYHESERANPFNVLANIDRLVGH